MMTRLIRVLRTCALGALGFNALFPLDAISGRKLPYSNPRLLYSNLLGVTCPPNSGAKQRGLLLPVTMNLEEPQTQASRPGGRPVELDRLPCLRIETWATQALLAQMWATRQNAVRHFDGS